MPGRGEGGGHPEAVLAVLLVISVLMMVFASFLSSNDLKNFGLQLIFGVQRVAGRSIKRLEDGFGSLRRLHDLREEYESLLSTLDSYQGIEWELKELRRENEILKTQLEFSESLSYDHIPAQVIAGDPSNLFSTMTLDRGDVHGIKTGMIVTALQSGIFGLLGKIVSVERKSCQVRPLVDPDSYVAARLHDIRFEGLVSGRGGTSGELIMQYVSKSAGPSIALNDLIVTSGMQSIYPRGIYIGRVQEVMSREYSTTLDIVVRPIVNTKQVEYVFILKYPR